MDHYTRHEAAWLLGLGVEEARDLDALLASSWGGGPTSDGDVGLPVVVLRNDVHAAAVRVAERALAAGGGREAGLTVAVLALRGRGWTLRAIAAALGVSHAHVARRYAAGLQAILEELGEPVGAAA